MGLMTRAVVGRWLARWLMRGSPLAVAAKLAAVGALGAWKYHRDHRKAERDPRGIDADYEVLGPDRIAPLARAPGDGAEPPRDVEGSGSPEVEGGPPRTSWHPFQGG